MGRCTDPTAEQILVRMWLVLKQQCTNRLARVFGDLELDGSARLLLDDSGSRFYVSAGGDIADFEPDQITASQLAVDREVEQRKISDIAIEFKSCPD